MNFIRSRLGQLVIVIALLLGIALAWYLISPLFLNDIVSEEFPAAEVDVAATAAIAIAEFEKIQGMDDVAVEEPMPTQPAEMVVLAQGQFYDVAHHGSGTATIYQLADGSRVLRFEDFEVLNGPDLHVYFSFEADVVDRVGQPLSGGYDLGKLKGNIGDQNYPIPDGFDLSSYLSVVIWCEPFQVPFSAARLVTP